MLVIASQFLQFEVKKAYKFLPRWSDKSLPVLSKGYKSWYTRS